MTDHDVPPNNWLIIGLGNPGPNFAHTRHNVGQMIIDEIAARLQCGLVIDPGRRARVAPVRFDGAGFNETGRGKAVLAKPLSAMNLSGTVVKSLVSYYRFLPENVVVLHDDVDIPFNAVKLKLGGGEGGHNGVRDISKRLGTKDYYRVRVGVGRPPRFQDTADFVLRPFAEAEKKLLPSLIRDGADAVEVLLTRGLSAAQNAYH